MVPEETGRRSGDHKVNVEESVREFWLIHARHFTSPIVLFSFVYEQYAHWIRAQASEGRQLPLRAYGIFGRQLRALIAESSEWTPVFVLPGSDMNRLADLTNPPSTRTRIVDNHRIVAFERNPGWINPSEPASVDEVWELGGTDATTMGIRRREQVRLRSYLLDGRDSANCDICGRELPASLLVAAHIKPRALSDEEHRKDFASIAMLACALGCDQLFELGYVIVDEDGVAKPGRDAETSALQSIVDQLVDRKCAAHNTRTARDFADHLKLVMAKQWSGLTALDLAAQCGPPKPSGMVTDLGLHGLSRAPTAG
ncbi:hypothetical protein H4V99_002948 [Cryobacterium sp. CG_9.6]|nr:hypothetical protein [Cryobacterium sp. CG_9.6]